MWFGQENKQQDKKQAQRRQYFRVVYPPAVAPEIVNIPAQVVDVSVKAVKFSSAESAAQKLNLNQGDKTDVAMKFRDGRVVDVAGTILRQETDASGKMFYICIFDEEIPFAIINDEQSYLLRNFPDFCRNKFYFNE